MLSSVLLAHRIIFPVALTATVLVADYLGEYQKVLVTSPTWGYSSKNDVYTQLLANRA